MKDVYLYPCDNYEQDAVRSAIASLAEDCGLLAQVHAGMRIVIKANLVSAMKPEKGATTHPMAIRALAELLVERGASVIVGDSPGGIYSRAYVGHIYRVSGMDTLIMDGCTLNDDYSVKEVDFPEGKVLKHFTYTAYLDSADLLINFCKLKSHGMMGMSACAKNMFGTIPGTMKPEYHFRFPKYEEFADMIVDLNEYFRPAYSFVDAVVGMEGNGPTAGTARKIGFFAVSPSPHKADLLCADILGIPLHSLPILQAAIRRGLAPEDAALVTTNVPSAALRVKDFVYLSTPKDLQFDGDGRGVKRFFAPILGKALRSKPKLKASECVGCGVCRDICPAKAIKIENKKAVIDRSQCILCFCCQEFCPKGAMKTKRPLLARIVGKL